jgi:putative transcriptional regulator
MVDPKELRVRLGLSQSEFAHRYKLSLRTVQGWETRKIPRDGAAQLLLLLIEREPETIARILSST